MPAKLTTEDFIAKARAVHGDRYDYSRVEYVAATCKVLLSCVKHGAFQQVPFVHLRGSGCPTCSRRASATTAFFIERATAVHGDRYDYSRAEYTTTKQPVTIGCAVHGFFRQAAADHVKGSGCPACGALARIAGKTKTTAWFVEQARAVHGDTYGYSQTIYIASNQALAMECTAHGVFKKRPISHLKGVGCPKCKPSPSTVYQERDTAWFVASARAVHGDKYEYDSAVYIGRHSKLVITCPVHGIFKQEAGKHLCGNGCPSCAGRQPALAQMLADVRAKASEGNDFTLTEYITPNGAVHIIYRGAIYRSNWHKPKYYYASSQVNGRHVRRALHRTIWEDYHGRPIPEGYHVHHKDENPFNNSPENLEAKPGGEHLREHVLARLQNPEYAARNKCQLEEAQRLRWNKRVLVKGC